MGLTQHDSGSGKPFDAMAPGLDHIGFRVAMRAELKAWARTPRYARHQPQWPRGSLVWNSAELQRSRRYRPGILYQHLIPLIRMLQCPMSTALGIVLIGMCNTGIRRTAIEQPLEPPRKGSSYRNTFRGHDSAFLKGKALRVAQGDDHAVGGPVALVLAPSLRMGAAALMSRTRGGPLRLLGAPVWVGPVAHRGRPSLGEVG